MVSTWIWNVGGTPMVIRARIRAADQPASDRQLAVEDLGATVLRQRRDAVRRQPRAILQRPSLPAFAGRLRHIEQREVTAHAADHGVAGAPRCTYISAVARPGLSPNPNPVAETVAPSGTQ